MSPELQTLLVRKLRLRPGCHLTLQNFGGDNNYVLEDAHTGQFFRMGMREHRFLQKLDGSKPLLQIAQELDPNGEIDLQTAIQFTQTLWIAGLLEDENRQTVPNPPGPRKKNLLLQNPLFLKFPLCNPDPFLTWLELRTRWLFSKWTIVLWLVMLVWAGVELSGDWERFTVSAEGVLAASNWLWLFIVFIVLKFVHELGHGLVAKHLGGRIPEAGLFFFFFAPLTYVDATSCWRFPSKWARIQVSLAGMFVELFFAAIAAIVWANTSPGILNTIAYNTVVTASVVTLLFNSNPLLRYDGYYVLADLTETPNLYSRAAKTSQQWLAWLFFGTKPSHDNPSWIGIYGISAMIWRFLLTLSISIAAIMMLHGFGVILAIFTYLATFRPWVRSGKGLAAKLRSAEQRPALLRPAIHFAVIFLALAAIAFVPIHPSIKAPAMIELADTTPIRTECPGFLQHIFVRSGQSVAKGQVLAQLSNPEERARLATLKTDLRLAEVRANLFREQRDPQKQSQELENVESLKTQIAEQAQYIDTLELRAPANGYLLAKDPDDLIGSYLSAGTEVMSIGSATERDVRIAVPQESGDIFRDRIGSKIKVYVPGRGETVDATITRFEPRATREARYEPLTASASGPLPIQRLQHQPKEGNKHPFELVDPVFYVTARIDTPDFLPLPGETCVIRCYSGESQPLWKLGWTKLDELIRRYIKQSDTH